jgi:hypothetical protein
MIRSSTLTRSRALSYVNRALDTQRVWRRLLLVASLAWLFASGSPIGPFARICAAYRHAMNATAINPR